MINTSFVLSIMAFMGIYRQKLKINFGCNVVEIKKPGSHFLPKFVERSLTVGE